jgi:spermidine synthase
MKKWLSYLWPISSKRQSEYNGTLEISWINGKKLLNSAGANYSYGTLQKVLEFGLQKINLSGVHNVLVLGLGGGSVIYSLRDKFGYSKKIVGVEWDKKILEIAFNDYGLEDFQDAIFVYDSAESFIATRQDKFDLIIVDLFVDTRVPSQFYEIEFWNKLNNVLIEQGQILFNAGFYDEDKTLIDELENQLKMMFQVERYDKVLSINTLMKLVKR